MNWPDRTLVFLGISNKTLSWPNPAAHRPLQTQAKPKLRGSCLANHALTLLCSRVETWVRWSTVQCGEPSGVSRAERLFSWFSWFYISSVKPRCIAINFRRSRLQGEELWPSILANVVVFWKYDCSVRFVLAFILVCGVSLFVCLVLMSRVLCLIVGFLVVWFLGFFESEVSFDNGIS